MSNPDKPIQPSFQHLCKYCNGTGFVVDRSSLAQVVADHAYFGIRKSFLSYQLVQAAKKEEGPLRSIIGGMNPKRVGKLLARLSGQPINGYYIERITDADDRDGAVWWVMTS
jgi:hypothetical protein